MNRHIFLSLRKRKLIKQLGRFYKGVTTYPYVKKVKNISINPDTIITQPVNCRCYNPREAEIKQQIRLLENKINELKELL